MTGVAGVLLAAGEGSRLGQPKALVRLGEMTLAERGVALLRAGGADPVLVVAGAAQVSLAGVRVVHNPDWRSGMGSSLRVGLGELARPDARAGAAADARAGAAADARAGAAADAAVIALADQPLVGAAAVRRLIAAYVAGASVAVAAYDGRPRNPVLIAAEHWPDVIASATGDQGARAFLRAHPALVTLVDCTGTGTPDDIDTLEDLARVRERALKRSLTQHVSWYPFVDRKPGRIGHLAPPFGYKDTCSVISVTGGGVGSADGDGRVGRGVRRGRRRCPRCALPHRGDAG